MSTYQKARPRNSTTTGRSYSFSSITPPASSGATLKVRVLMGIASFVLLVVLFVFFSYRKFPTSVSQSDTNFARLSNNLSIIDSKVSELKVEIDKKSNEMKKQKKAFDSQITQVKNDAKVELYDSSSVGLSIYENIENYARKYKRRWVLPCLWENCRFASLDQVLLKLTDKLLTDKDMNLKQIKAAQLGSSSSFLSFLTSNELDFHLTVVSTNEEAKKIDKNQIELREIDVPDAAKKFKDESLDFLYVDLDFSDLHKLKKTLLAFFPKLKIGAYLFGTNYGVLTPDKSFNGLTREEEDKYKIMKQVKSQVDDFVISSSEEFMGTGGVVILAGSNTWFIRKKKLTFGDLFGGSS